jgi:hypothetical protein
VLVEHGQCDVAMLGAMPGGHELSSCSTEQGRGATLGMYRCGVAR